MSRKIRCLIINGLDRGTVVDLYHAPPELHVAIPPKVSLMASYTRTKDWDPTKDHYRRVYRRCFVPYDGEVVLYSTSGSSLDILAEREWIMPKIDAVNVPIVFLRNDIAIVEQSC